jgi:hypothetical protein
MVGLVAGGRLVAVAEVLGQVFGEVADAPAGVAGSGEHALGVEPAYQNASPRPGQAPSSTASPTWLSDSAHA